MPTITTAEQATMLQLQDTASSCGLRRSYLGTDFTQPQVDNAPRPCKFSVMDHVSRPDIKWNPSYETFLKRVERLAALGDDRPTALPEGFPASVDSARVWSGVQFENPCSYTLQFSETDIKEIENGLAYFKGLPGDHSPDEVTKETFPLPGLAARLYNIAHSLHYGRGFAVLRGLDPDRFSPLDNMLLYLGITSYIAETRGAQDYDGRMVVHIKDMEKNIPPETGRPSPYSSRAQPFHTDRCDILAMYALGVGAVGGESLLASSGKIYNEIAANRPDIIHVLAMDDWIFDEFLSYPKWQTGALLFDFGTHGPSFCYSRRPITGAPFSPHTPGVPAMTEIQAEALDMVHFTAKKHQISIPLQKGDIEIFNNLALFHGREGFIDDEAHKRHFLRLWLKNVDMAWETPDTLRSQTAELYDKEGLDAPPKWDVDYASPVPRVITRHMRCS